MKVPVVIKTPAKTLGQIRLELEHKRQMYWLGERLYMLGLLNKNYGKN